MKNIICLTENRAIWTDYTMRSDTHGAERIKPGKATGETGKRLQGAKDITK